MAYIKYNNLWQGKIYNIVSAKDKVQELNLNE